MSDFAIAAVHAREIFDSRGRPTVEVDVHLESGATGRAAAPSGASTGRSEALELRDGGTRFAGRGVRRAVDNVRSEIAAALRGCDVREQRANDERMRALDGTSGLQRLGANATVATSMALARAAAAARREPLVRSLGRLLPPDVVPSLPMPMMNVLSGGAHAQRGMDFQDFLVMPVAATTLDEALEALARIRTAADGVLEKRGLTTLLADEGGVSPGCASASDALDLLLEAIQTAGFAPGRDVAIALDVAASEFAVDDAYELQREGRTLSAAEMIALLATLAERYPIVSIEDGLAEDDWAGWVELTQRLGHLQLVGDDLFTTDVQRIERGVRSGVANAVLIKINQIGTLSGALDALAAARAAGYAAVVSARSGETEDAFLADLAVASGAGQIKIGSFRSSERLSKYNQLLRIAEDPALAFARWPRT